jgi:hypothetical protein
MTRGAFGRIGPPSAGTATRRRVCEFASCWKFPRSRTAAIAVRPPVPASPSEMGPAARGPMGHPHASAPVQADRPQRARRAARRPGRKRGRALRNSAPRFSKSMRPSKQLAIRVRRGQQIRDGSFRAAVRRGQHAAGHPGNPQRRTAATYRRRSGKKKTGGRHRPRPPAAATSAIRHGTPTTGARPVRRAQQPRPHGHAPRRWTIAATGPGRSSRPADRGSRPGADSAAVGDPSIKPAGIALLCSAYD